MMEALAIGRPVLGTYIAGVPGVSRTENGWLVPAGNVQSRTSAILSILRTAPDELTLMEGGADRRENHDAAKEAGRLKELLSASLLASVK